MNQPQHIKIFDTTLRDGQQCPGAGMSFEKNISYARLCAKAGIDILEAGFPAASRTDYLIVNTIAEEFAAEKESPTVAALCQLREKQFEITINALTPAIKSAKARLHTYVPVDPRLMHCSLGTYAKHSEQIIKDVYQLIKQAINAGLEVEFTPEGYSCMGENFNLVTDLIRAAVSAGATIINCPDTIGGACKLQRENYFVEHMKTHAAIIQKEFPDKNIIWSAHCHNDFGLALENTMNAIFAGPATQIEGCFNGIGERAGNVSLEQCVMYMKHFGLLNNEKQFFTKIKTEMLQTISDFVSQNMLTRQSHWPITGDNAARHSSGGHTNAIIKNPLAYQPFDPKETGNTLSFLFGPFSGGNHAKSIIEKFGYYCEDSEKSEVAQFIKNWYLDRRKGITEQELLQAYFSYRMPIKVTRFEYAKKNNKNILKITGQFFEHKKIFAIEYHGNDSVLRALFDSIQSYLPGIKIENYHSQSSNKGVDSKSQSKILLRNEDDELFTGHGEDHDIEISALKALVDAVNQAYINKIFKKEEIV